MYNKSTLKALYKMTQKEVRNYAKKELEKMDYTILSKAKDGFLYATRYRENDVLIVAHMDIVGKTPPTVIRDHGGILTGYHAGKRCILGGDDRNGVYAALKLALVSGCSALLTEDEECGAIGATDFEMSKISPDVNFIVEVDRRGVNDAVFYGCDNPKFTNFVTSFGFSEEQGSFSDISIIAPGIAAGVNISAGYFNEHTAREFTDFHALERNIERVSHMLNANRSFEYIAAEPVYKYYDDSYYYGGTYSKWTYKTEYIPDYTIDDIDDIEAELEELKGEIAECQNELTGDIDDEFWSDLIAEALTRKAELETMRDELRDEIYSGYPALAN